MSTPNDLPPSVISYKPQILKIKIGPFRPWIEKRLTELLEGLEDEILWGLVFNYLEDAQKRSKHEGPAVNPSGGLNAKEIQTALSGFLGTKNSRNFTIELFNLLAKAETSETGIPPEFNMKPEDAEKEALRIIQGKRKEMELSDRVNREIRRTFTENERYHGDRRRDYRERGRHYNYKEYDDYDKEYRGRSHGRTDRSHRNYSRSPQSRHRDRYEYDRHHRRYREDSRERYNRHDHSRNRDDEKEEEYRRNEHFHHNRHSSRSLDLSIRRRTSSKSPIPSSSSSSSSPSPCWETTLDVANSSAPRAPIAHVIVSRDLESAL